MGWCKHQNILDVLFIFNALPIRYSSRNSLFGGLNFTDWPLSVALIDRDSLKEQNKRVTRWGRPGHSHTPIEYQLDSLTRGWKGESMSVLDVSQKRVWGWRGSRKEGGKGPWAVCISYSRSIIYMCCLKTVNVPWRLYLENIEKDLNLISQIIF